MHLSHPLCVTVCQIIIDRDDIYPFALQCVQVCRKRRYQCLTFTGTHLRDTSLMEDHATDDLYPVVFHIQYTLCGFPNRRKCLRKKIIE